jgi:hypothetical protein
LTERGKEIPPLVVLTAGAHDAEARTMHAHTAWTADGALAVSGRNLSSHGRGTIEVDDAGNLVDSYGFRILRLVGAPRVAR